MADYVVTDPPVLDLKTPVTTPPAPLDVPFVDASSIAAWRYNCRSTSTRRRSLMARCRLSSGRAQIRYPGLGRFRWLVYAGHARKE